MHALEKSDCAVVLVKQPNKEGRPSAEAVEGRAQTKENIVPSHMHPTQSGKRVSQGLNGVRKAARKSKEQRFTALLHHLSIELLRESFYALQRKPEPRRSAAGWHPPDRSFDSCPGRKSSTRWLLPERTRATQERQPRSSSGRGPLCLPFEFLTIERKLIPSDCSLRFRLFIAPARC
jgi:hypothetical protein